MRGVHEQSVWPFSSQASFPIVVDHAASPNSPLLLIVVLLALAAGLFAPFLLVAEHLARDPATRAVVLERPQAAIQVLLALAFCATLFGWPLVRFARVLTRRRSVVIDPTTVTVTERSLFSRRTWREPLAGYMGLAHTVRTSLSGFRDELNLVHADPSRTILLAVASRITPEDVARAVNFLDLAEIPSRDAHTVRHRSGMLGPAAAQPRLG